ncbi:MAG: PilZ domain-containing protein [Treponema sp.]|jgi:hypothetical protein|nr:PilZ domain-containing protein [Treponema sp.]
MEEQRKSARYKTIARARIPALFEGESLLKDISITGCCIECTMQVEAHPDTKYGIVIEPEGSSRIGQFELIAEYRWNRSGSDACIIGFFIVEFPKGKQFQRYVDYLAYHSS